MIGCLAFVLTLQVGAQTKPAVAPKKEVYQAVATKTNDLVHTALDASFDFSNATLIGKVKLTLHPHHYPTNSLVLDAKGMDVKEVPSGKADEVAGWRDSLAARLETLESLLADSAGLEKLVTDYRLDLQDLQNAVERVKISKKRIPDSALKSVLAEFPAISDLTSRIY